MVKDSENYKSLDALYSNRNPIAQKLVNVQGIGMK